MDGAMSHLLSLIGPTGHGRHARTAAAEPFPWAGPPPLLMGPLHAHAREYAEIADSVVMTLKNLPLAERMSLHLAEPQLTRSALPPPAGRGRPPPLLAEGVGKSHAKGFTSFAGLILVILDGCLPPSARPERRRQDAGPRRW
ncbi:hypothetical protein GCM10012280_56950 [Wenjunlia tyrosinilytica]|uniref:Uncharacterized protein n=1 Tax=Wenjunlia tyrosinilytica TaxID=1544741 RepID=A0A917ZWG3_9ACTN|nr:hypothetical protein GCM10012280_56950 [Wenjunlia tyrosinilytica]